MSTDYTALVEVALARYKLACDEMDRLTAGNPGNTWRWSIPANPDRDSDLILSASAEDVPRLVSAVEALLAERDALRTQLGTERDYSTISSAIRVRDANIRQLTRENEELRTQLDSMIKRHASALGAISRVRANVMTTDGDYLDGQSFDGLAGEVQAALGSWLEGQ